MLLFLGPISEVLDRPGIRTWSTVFVAIEALEENSWVEVVGTLARPPHNDSDIPIVITAEQLTPIDAPDHPDQ